MATTSDLWYVRLPDGRVIRSHSTVSLRHHLRKGRIPPTSRVRRSANDEWHELADVDELADAAESGLVRGNGQPTKARRRRNRADFREWRLLGVRGLAGELLDALDSSLHRTKLGVAAALGVLGAVAWITSELVHTGAEDVWWTAGAVAWVGVMLLGACLGISLITRFTAFEISRMRAPRNAELWPLALTHAVRLAVALALVVGGGAGLVLLFRWLPTWMNPPGGEAGLAWEYAASATLILRLILEVVFWPVIALAPLLLSPILVIQQNSVLSAIREWWRILRHHLGRIFLYEALATTLGAVFTLPLLVPIALASGSLGSITGLEHLVGQTTLVVLTGIAMTPFLAYLLVANVFIYLNLRYEFFHSAR